MDEQRRKAGQALAALRKRATLICDNCGKPFESFAAVANGERRYHSASCRASAWQKRRRAARRIPESEVARLLGGG